MVPSENGEQKTSVHLLAGFLGSGKTTLLNRILSWDVDLSDTVVLVNEFGSIGVDGSLIESTGNEVVELTSGCICCTLKTELAETLLDIAQRFRPKRILLEATGVAEPDAVSAVLRSAELRPIMELRKIITVLDIRFWNGREIFGPFFMNQLLQADLLLLNKIDNADKERVGAAVSEIQKEIPGIRIVPTHFCNVDPEVLWEAPNTPSLDNFYPTLPSTARSVHNEKENDDPTACGASGHAHRPEEIAYDTFSFSVEGVLHERRFKKFLEDLPWQLFRIKGPVRFPDRTLMLNYVAGQVDWRDWRDAGGTRLAFIGWGIDADSLLGSLQECLLKP